VVQARSYLKSIFSDAVEQDFLVKDPSRKVTIPKDLRKILARSDRGYQQIPSFLSCSMTTSGGPL